LFSFQRISANDKGAVFVWIRDINDPQIASGTSLPKGNSRALAARSILSGELQNLLDFVFLDAMSVDVRQARLRIDIEPQFHPAIRG
jgi:hypothetical protein